MTLKDIVHPTSSQHPKDKKTKKKKPKNPDYKLFGNVWLKNNSEETVHVYLLLTRWGQEAKDQQQFSILPMLITCVFYLLFFMIQCDDKGSCGNGGVV